MARRLTLVVAVVLAVAIGGCATTSGGLHGIWRSGPGADGGLRGPAPDVAASPLPPASTVPGDLRTGPGPYGTITTTGSAAVALTFDDGPSSYTASVLDLLERYRVHATFCLIGRKVAAYAALARRIVADGDTLCNHTFTHDLWLGIRSPDVIRSELHRTGDAIHAIVPGARIAYFRNPGGNFTPTTIAIAKTLGMASIYWSVDPRDWSRPGTKAIISIVVGAPAQARSCSCTTVGVTGPRPWPRCARSCPPLPAASP